MAQQVPITVANGGNPPTYQGQNNPIPPPSQGGGDYVSPNAGKTVSPGNFNDTAIKDLYDTYASGKQSDAIARSAQYGNPWAINIINQYQSTYGRMPTATEVQAAEPAFQAGDSQGNAFIAQQKLASDNSPANVYAKQQQQWQASAPQNYGTVNQITQSLLGRDATADEQSHFGTLIASGQADPYQIQQFFQATPEYQNKQDTQFRQGLDTQLQQSDQNYFNLAKGDITQQYAMMGRATSPALDVALTDLAAQQNQNRQTYLAQLSASQYGGNKQQALSDYSQTQNQVQGQINQNTQGIYGAQQAFQARGQNLADYNTQAQQFSQMMNQYGNKKPGALDYLNAGLNAAQTGAKLYSAF